MRFALGLLIFVIAGPLIAGIAVLVLISAPELGYHGFDVAQNFGWVAGIAFLVALPISFIFSGVLARGMRNSRTA